MTTPPGPTTTAELTAAIKDLTTTEQLIATEQLTSLAAELSQRGHIAYGPATHHPPAHLTLDHPSIPHPQHIYAIGEWFCWHNPAWTFGPTPFSRRTNPLTTVAWHATNVMTMLTCYYQHPSPDIP